jgi:hypothetical protein
MASSRQNPLFAGDKIERSEVVIALVGALVVRA